MKQSLRMLAAAFTLTLTLPALTAAETWVLDVPHTVSGFTVRHMMITNVTGAFEVTKGTIEYKPGDDGAAPPRHHLVHALHALALLVHHSDPDAGRRGQRLEDLDLARPLGAELEEIHVHREERTLGYLEVHPR